MIRRRRDHWFRTAMNALVSREAAAAIAMIGSLGWLHSTLGDLNARQEGSTAEAVQLRADIRELRMELANCRRQE